MSPDEWLGIVAWVNQRHKGWTVDQAARLGVLFRSYEATVVRGAISRLLDRGDELTPKAIKNEMHTSKYGGILQAKHRQLYPRGCANRFCDVCLDIRPPIRNNVLHD